MYRRYSSTKNKDELKCIELLSDKIEGYDETASCWKSFCYAFYKKTGMSIEIDKIKRKECKKGRIPLKSDRLNYLIV